MFRLRLYYYFKPILPWGLRMATRRFFAKPRRILHQKTWPINEECGVQPRNWIGWKEKKQFAFVLTHDVESAVGYRNAIRLAELEKDHGFRSSFNFVPEGDYRVEDCMLEQLRSMGCEVGVHGLRHDGKLYFSKSRFLERAKKINQYLKTWNAVGFRSPLMHRNLDWIHHLDIQYDLSTFDTDPFEPQPGGLGTIFPKWIPKSDPDNIETKNNTSVSKKLNLESHPQLSNKSQVTPSRLSQSNASQLPGYVELPYTLPQDSTLFLLLQEKNNSIWKRKIDWIASQGGMALLNVHPDYINFKDKYDRSSYPISLYTDFLHYVSAQYKAQFWHATPTSIAKFFLSSL